VLSHLLFLLGSDISKFLNTLFSKHSYGSVLQGEKLPATSSSRNRENLSASLHLYGPGNYLTVRRLIRNRGDSELSMAETASLLCRSVRGLSGNSQTASSLKNRWLWGFTGALYVPREGIFIEDNPSVRDEVAEFYRRLSKIWSGNYRSFKLQICPIRF
jgi:hypothetical protein